MCYVGQVFDSKRFGEYKVVSYVTKTTVLVKFLLTGYETVATVESARLGEVTDRLHPTHYGVGFLGNEVVIGEDYKKLYSMWWGMLRRCFGGSKQNKTYEGCDVSANFRNFSFFASWCRKQIGYGVNKFELDKDLLSKEVKIYSEDTCVFIPKEVNLFLKGSKGVRGKYVIGVGYDKVQNKYKVSDTSWCRDGKRYETEWEAFFVYKQAKEQRAKELANKWRDQIDIRVYDALMNYKVRLTD